MSGTCKSFPMYPWYNYSRLPSSAFVVALYLRVGLRSLSRCQGFFAAHKPTLRHDALPIAQQTLKPARDDLLVAVSKPTVRYLGATTTLVLCDCHVQE